MDVAVQTLPARIEGGALVLALVLLAWQARPVARYLAGNGGEIGRVHV